MHESELWITGLFNNHLAGLGNFFLSFAGMHEERPWADFIVMQLLVAAIFIVVFPLLRARLSAENPGKLQQTFELIYEFVHDQAVDQVGHAANRYISFFGAIFLFVLACNLIGMIPAFMAPTGNASVTCGCALATFVYYHLMGIREHGFKYVAHFMGPMWWLAPLMFPIEVVSHLARVLSLTARLYANMFAGEQVTLVFLQLTKFAVPVIFMGLHVFVGVIQAYIFMLLAMVYVGSAVAHEH
jgi:F-type H+-transporting ATPase subunit a